MGSPLLKQGKPLSNINATVVMIPSICRRAARYPFTHNLDAKQTSTERSIFNNMKWAKTVMTKEGAYLQSSLKCHYYLKNWFHVSLFITPDGSSNCVISWLSLKCALSKRIFPPGEVSRMKPKSI